ncbi:MAG: recombination mediator RecR [Pirellulales bacterium]
MDQVSQSVGNLVDNFTKLPGIGRKTAERLAYHVLRMQEAEAMALAEAIQRVKQNVNYCTNCCNLTEQGECAICRDPQRDKSRLLIVEQPQDLLALEETGAYRGLYHVLLGQIAPLDGVGPDQLTIDRLVQRVRAGDIKEIIMGTNPTVEGDGTAQHIANVLAEYPVEITRLGRGVISGSALQFANKDMLSDALSGRQPL